MSESTAVTNIISRSSKVSEIWDSVDPSVLCKIKNKKKFGGEIFRSVRFPRTFKVTIPPGPINSGLIFVFTEIYRNCCCCCNQKTTQCTVGIQIYLRIKRDHKSIEHMLKPSPL